MRRYYLSACAIILLTGNLLAQSSSFNAKRPSGISFELFRPQFSQNDYISGLAGYFSAWGPLSENITIKAEIPYAHASINYYYWTYGTTSESDDAIGNPYIGIVAKKGNSAPGEIEFGIRLPITPKDSWSAHAVGQYSDVHRLEAFSTDCLTVKGAIGARTKGPTGWGTYFNAGPTLLINTNKSENGGDAHEVLLSYEFLAGFTDTRVSFHGGISGNDILTQGDIFSEGTTLNQFMLGGEINFERVTPGINIAFPLEKHFRHVMDFVISGKIQIGI